MGEIMKVRMTEEFMEQLFTRDNEGNKLSVEWGEADEEGFYCPTISVDYDDNIVAQLEGELEKLQIKNGENAGEYVERRIMDIFQEVAEHVGNGVFELDHPAPIIRGSIAMTNAWSAYISQHPIDSVKSPPNSA